MSTNLLRRTTWLLAAIAGSALLVAASAYAESPATIEPAELAARIADGSAPVMLDVRAVTEYTGGHIPGAINIPHTELAARLAEVIAGKDDELVVYCRSGGRAALAETALREAGYHGIRLLIGHMLQWQKDQRPLAY